MMQGFSYSAMPAVNTLAVGTSDTKRASAESRSSPRLSKVGSTFEGVFVVSDVPTSKVSAPEVHLQTSLPWRQPKDKLMISLVNSYTNATRIGWHLWEIDVRFGPGLPPGWRRGGFCVMVRLVGTALNL